MKYHVRNTTELDRATVAEVIRFILDRLPPLPEFDVQLRNGRSMAGRAYCRGSSYHDNSRPFVVLRVPPQQREKCGVVVGQDHQRTLHYVTRWYYPRKLWVYQRAQLKGRRYYVANRVECLVHVAAHEIRHLWQDKYRHAGRYPGGRGVFSEVDTESFAIHILRAWRKAH